MSANDTGIKTNADTHDTAIHIIKFDYWSSDAYDPSKFVPVMYTFAKEMMKKKKVGKPIGFP